MHCYSLKSENIAQPFLFLVKVKLNYISAAIGSLCPAVCGGVCCSADKYMACLTKNYFLGE